MTGFIIAAVVVAVFFAAQGFMFGGRYRSISPREAERLIAEEKVHILDVRTSGEYSQGRIKGAELIPLGEVGRRMERIPRDQKILIYCASGGRSRMAASILARKGFGRLFNLGGGINAWQRAGLPVVRR